MKDTPFEIKVPDYSSSPEDWVRAQQVPRSKLPALSDDQKGVTRKFKISEEEYARGVLAGVYGRERKVARARRLGEEVQRIFDELGTGDRVIALVYDMDRLRWIIRIRTREEVRNVAISAELADDVVDWALREQVEELKTRVLYGLGRDEAMEQRH